MPDAIIGLLAFVGAVLYASVAIAYAKVERHRMILDDLIPRRVATTIFFLCAWGTWIGWAQVSTKGFGPLSNEAFLSILPGVIIFIAIMVANWAPDADDAKIWEAIIWPLSFLAIALSGVGKHVVLGVSRLPNTIGTYIASYVNESRNPEVKDAA